MSLAAADYHALIQYVEGPQWRELSSDVHSVSLLVRSSVANLNFGVLLKDPGPSTKTLSKLCTLGAANTWTLITLPNLPVWPSGNFVTTPGSIGYQFLISLACGSTNLSPANDTWQTGAFFGAAGQSNFAGSAVNSTFDIAFVQHEPGNACSTFIDNPFTQNLDSCLRYYQKSYPYATAIGAVSNIGMKTLISPIATTLAYGPLSFLKPMAKLPTVTLYNNATGASGSVQDGGAVNHAGAVANAIGDAGFPSVGFTTATTGPMAVNLHYTADSGW